MNLEIDRININISDEELDILKKAEVVKTYERTNFQGNVYETLEFSVETLIEKFIKRLKGIRNFFAYDGSLNSLKLLVLLMEYKGVNPKMIMERLDTSNATTHRAIQELIKKGFVRKVETGLYQITDEGEKFVNKLALKDLEE